MLTSSRSNKNQLASVYSCEDYEAVNGWDGAVGTISDTAVFGLSFTLSMTNGRRNNAQTASDSVAVSGDGLQGEEQWVFSAEMPVSLMVHRSPTITSQGST